MTGAANYLVGSITVGAGATLLMDVGAIARNRLGGAPLPDYGLVGRWIAHMPGGRFHHESIAASPRVRGERLIGWSAHYFIGIAFAAALLLVWGIDWWRHPTLAPALIVGMGSVAAPFLLMQPGMGVGIAASRSPNPAAARVRSLATHGIFGFGLYAAAWVTSL